MALNKRRISIKCGDIFEIKLKNSKKYFQFVLKNIDYMDGDLIRGFYFECNSNYKPQTDEILNSGITAYTHTWIKPGIKEGFWEKIGNVQIEQGFESPFFRQTNDHLPQVQKSHNWFIWKGDIDNKIDIGELTDKYRKLPLSGINTPASIIKWIEKGDAAFKKPN